MKLLMRWVTALVAAFVAQAATAITFPGGTTLQTDYNYVTENGSYFLRMQGDGNLVVYRSDGSARWYSQTQGNPGARTVIQGDGNLVIYASNNTPLWYTSTQGNPGAYLALQGDGNLVVYSASNQALWHIGSDSWQVDICDSQGIPSGWAVIRRYTTGQCAGNLGTRTIRPISSPMQVCSETLVPLNWVVTSMSSNPGCYDGTRTSTARQTWTMSLPVSPMIVCDRSVQPAGYVITGMNTANGCAHADGSLTNAAYTIKIPDAYEPHVCANSLIPSGYTVVQSLYWAQCPAASGQLNAPNAVGIQRNY